jgi:hypothetical protein
VEEPVFESVVDMVIRGYVVVDLLIVDVGEVFDIFVEVYGNGLCTDRAHNLMKNCTIEATKIN